MSEQPSTLGLVTFLGTVIISIGFPAIMIPTVFYDYFKRQCCPIPVIVSMAVTLPLTALLVWTFRWICGWFA